VEVKLFTQSMPKRKATSLSADAVAAGAAQLQPTLEDTFAAAAALLVGGIGSRVVLKAHRKKAHKPLSADAAIPLKGKKGYYAVRGNTATNAAAAKILPVQGESKVAERDSARKNKIKPQKDGVRKVANISQESRRNHEAPSSSAKRTLFKSNPNQFKGVEGGVQCIGCNEKLMAAWKLRPSKILKHLTSQYHIEAVAAREMQVADNTRLDGFLVRMKANMRSPLPDKTFQFRASVVQCFLENGVPIGSIDGFRTFLESISGQSLTHSSHLRAFVPEILKAMNAELVEIIKAKEVVAVTHDGTNRFSEFIAVVFRWTTKDFVIEQRVAKVHALEKNPKGAQLGNVILSTCIEFGIDLGTKEKAGGLLCTQRDRASSNQMAMSIVTSVYKHSLDAECLSHATSKVGEKMPHCALTDWRSKFLLAMNQHGFKAWMTSMLAGNVPKPCKTRWYSYWELYDWFLTKHLATAQTRYQAVMEFCKTASAELAGDVAEDSVRIERLKETALNQLLVDRIQLQMQVLVSTCKPFVEMCYACEGDGPTALIVWGHLTTIRAWVTKHSGGLTFPGLQQQIDHSVVTRIAVSASLNPPVELNPDICKAEIEEEIRQMIAPGLSYCTSVLDDDGELAADIGLYELCSTMNPLDHDNTYNSWIAAAAMRVPPSNVDAIFKAQVASVFPGRFSEIEIDGMVSEMPVLKHQIAIFLANWRAHVVSDTNPNPPSKQRLIAIWEFWREQHKFCRLPNLQNLTRLMFTIPASSAAAERCFSILKLCFDAQQLQAGAHGAQLDLIHCTLASRFKAGNVSNDFHPKK
jgi:hypothetical protein